MTFISLYICVSLAVVIETRVVRQFANREAEDYPEKIIKKSFIPILKQTFEQSKEGYQHSYETGNGIHAEESGYIKNKGDEKNEIFVQQGTITYHDEHGNPITLTYVADEEGFRPQGDHLPVQPSIPTKIIESIEEKTEIEHQEQQKTQLPQEPEYEDSEQLEVSQREYQRNIQHQIQDQLQQHQYQHQQVYQAKQFHQEQEQYQPQNEYQPQHQYISQHQKERKNYQSLNY